MDARPLTIKDIFGRDRRHVVPLFQRPYVWTREAQWSPLWRDIQWVADRLVKGKDTRPHFLGAIVLEQVRKPYGHLETCVIIDGQQRLTTIQLLLEAFCDLCVSPSVERHHKALYKLTRNDDPMSDDADDQFKVWPTNVDQEHFRRVMCAESPEELRKVYGSKLDSLEVGHPLGDAYLFFSKEISDWLSQAADGFEDRVDKLYTVLREYIRMVVIDLDDNDDPQVIFETLNARGTPLLPADLVRNFLYHRGQQEGENLELLYDRYWKRFDAESDYWRATVGRGHAKRPRIDTYLHHYLTLKTKEEVPVGNLYTAFRSFLTKADSMNVRGHLESLCNYAAIYQDFDRLRDGTGEALFFDRLATMETTTAYPFLLELFQEFGSQRNEIKKMLLDLESFLVRRMVCQLNTRGYNVLFVELLGALNAGDGPGSARVRAYLLSLDAESNRWPTDSEFQDAWLQEPLYRRLARNRMRMLLEAIERRLLEKQVYTGKTERIKLRFEEKLTIEHLMPRDWRKHWPLPDEVDTHEGEREREKVLNTVGNLTLLTKKLNPSVSNGPWERKQRSILKHSMLQLNQQLRDENAWSEGRILARAKALFKLALEIWPRPKS